MIVRAMVHGSKVSLIPKFKIEPKEKVGSQGNMMVTKNEEMCAYSTTDYDKFTKLNGNRTENVANINAIKKSMSEDQLIVPAIVNENYQIIDGQHRLKACEELGVEFYFIIVEGYGLDQVQRINAHMKNWNDTDYLESFINRYNNGEPEFKQYVLLKEFMTSNGITNMKAALVLAYDGLATEVPKIAFRTGTFKFNNLNRAEDFASKALNFEEFFPKQWNTAGFLSVFIGMARTEHYNHDFMVGNLPTQWVKFAETSGISGWRTTLVEIYNYKRRRTDRIESPTVKYAMEDIAAGKA